MTVKVFMKIDGIPGESTDANYRDQIELVSYNLGVTRQGSVNAGPGQAGTSAGRADFLPFTFVKVLDKASPIIALACAAGTRIKSIVVTVCRDDGTTLSTMAEFVLEDCIFSSWRENWSEQGAEVRVTEEGTITYCRIMFSHCFWKPDGSARSQSVMAWDLVRNKAIGPG